MKGKTSGQREATQNAKFACRWDDARARAKDGIKSISAAVTTASELQSSTENRNWIGGDSRSLVMSPSLFFYLRVLISSRKFPRSPSAEKNTRQQQQDHVKSERRSIVIFSKPQARHDEADEVEWMAEKISRDIHSTSPSPSRQISACCWFPPLASGAKKNRTMMKRGEERREKKNHFVNKYFLLLVRSVVLLSVSNLVKWDRSEEKKVFSAGIDFPSVWQRGRAREEQKQRRRKKSGSRQTVGDAKRRREPEDSSSNKSTLCFKVLFVLQIRAITDEINFFGRSEGRVCGRCLATNSLKDEHDFKFARFFLSASLVERTRARIFAALKNFR